MRCFQFKLWSNMKLQNPKKIKISCMAKLKANSTGGSCTWNKVSLYRTTIPQPLKHTERIIWLRKGWYYSTALSPREKLGINSALLKIRTPFWTMLEKTSLYPAEDRACGWLPTACCVELNCRNWENPVLLCCS